jgi:glycosyltransferase 2 family protein
MNIKKTVKPLMPVITIIFFGLVAWLLYESLATIEWAEVELALRKVSWKILLPAAALVGINYSILASYDFLAMKHLHIPAMPYPKVFISAFICYALTLNIGAFVGGLGFRFRIYSGWQVPKKKIPKIIFFSTLTNWLGYVLLLGIVFIIRSESLQQLLPLSGTVISTLGWISCLGVAGYLYLCATHRAFKYQKHKFQLPHLPVALLQLFLASIQWTLLAGIIYYLLFSMGARVEYPQVLVTLLFASIAGVITHIPAGLGVLETVFLRMQLDVAQADLFVALISFRAVYYILPLVIALPSYFSLEVYQKKKHTRLKAQQLLSH